MDAVFALAASASDITAAGVVAAGLIIRAIAVSATAARGRDVASYEEQQELVALLQMLSLGALEIENGDYLFARVVFADADRKLSQ